MNKKEFLRQLRYNLNSLSKPEIDEILIDFEEHFIIGEEQGKSEQEISALLGDPRIIAMQFSGTDNVSMNKSAGTKIAAAAGLFCLNFFAVIWLFVGVYATVVGLWASAIAIVFSGAISSLFSVLYPFTKGFANFSFHPLITFLIGLILVLIGLLFTNFCIFITKWLVKITKKYINWNINILK